MTVTVVEIASIPEKPQTVSDCIAFLQDAVKNVPPNTEPLLSIEADGTWRVIYYRNVTGAEKLADFVKSNPEVTKKDLADAAAAAAEGALVVVPDPEVALAVEI